MHGQRLVDDGGESASDRQAREFCVPRRRRSDDDEVEVITLCEELVDSRHDPHAGMTVECELGTFGVAADHDVETVVVVRRDERPVEDPAREAVSDEPDPDRHAVTSADADTSAPTSPPTAMPRRCA